MKLVCNNLVVVGHPYYPRSITVKPRQETIPTIQRVKNASKIKLHSTATDTETYMLYNQI